MQAQQKKYKLTTKNIFNHFLLVHDFLYQFSKAKAENSQFFDAQLDVQTIMNSATLNGGRAGQIISLLGVTAYCLKSKSIPLKFMAGFLYFYWINHCYTLGSYCGAIIKMPSAYRRVGFYYQNFANSHPNLLDKFEDIMEHSQQYQDTNDVLASLFPDQIVASTQTHITNDYFVKNRDKYLPKSEDSLNSNKLKLTYLDSFLTRYVYYSFTRWFRRLKLFLGLEME